MRKIEFDYTYMIYRIQGDHHGSYYVIDYQNRKIARSEGFTVRRRTILYEDLENQITYEVVPRKNDMFFIMTEGVIDSMFKLEKMIFVDKLYMKLDEKVQYDMKSVGTPKHFYITHKGKGVGRFKTTNWVNRPIRLELDDPTFVHQVLCGIIYIAYLMNIDAAGFFNSPEK